MEMINKVFILMKMEKGKHRENEILCVGVMMMKKRHKKRVAREFSEIS
jgi:hypothetical protein